jgi:hypothetical protein
LLGHHKQTLRALEGRSSPRPLSDPPGDALAAANRDSRTSRYLWLNERARRRRVPLVPAARRHILAALRRKTS